MSDANLLIFLCHSHSAQERQTYKDTRKDQDGPVHQRAADETHPARRTRDQARVGKDERQSEGRRDERCCQEGGEVLVGAGDEEKVDSLPRQHTYREQKDKIGLKTWKGEGAGVK